MSTPPTIRKARAIQGRTLRFTNANESDASFIVALRTDPVKAAHISATSSSLEDQLAWLRRYAASTDEAYFVIRGANQAPIGTVRLYDPRGSSFCWGSWIMHRDAPSAAAIESAVMVYRYALDELGFESSHFSVNRDNDRVWAFHERFGATRVGEDLREYEYRISNDAIRRSLDRFARYCPGPLGVEH
jgi:RimJ/RimL family protein N-acetyltransferase